MAAEIAHIDPARCSGCGRCLSACELRLLAFETKAWKKRTVLQDIDRCSGCGECAARCPTGAISMADAYVSDRNQLR
jgi:NAD-dependent dihydropyrimidine dehydrogenase PreA subunit